MLATGRLGGGRILSAAKMSSPRTAAAVPCGTPLRRMVPISQAFFSTDTTPEIKPIKRVMAANRGDLVLFLIYHYNNRQFTIFTIFFSPR